ncbi:hypothetical protein OJF2_14500 [Aquisphaera giovannonii]|uniref:Uncharacterized protein n=1 Tax=Aquisphaera giovannonii TaxID=406548 RepID=A0A5B9VXF9_9BACT|nr:hypothetical protein OJF2_14500 [Aquisphaera giovannonii]
MPARPPTARAHRAQPSQIPTTRPEVGRNGGLLSPLEEGREGTAGHRGMTGGAVASVQRMSVIGTGRRFMIVWKAVTSFAFR